MFHWVSHIWRYPCGHGMWTNLQLLNHIGLHTDRFYVSKLLPVDTTTIATLNLVLNNLEMLCLRLEIFLNPRPTNWNVQ